MKTFHDGFHLVLATSFDLISPIAEALDEGLRVLLSDDGSKEGFFARGRALMRLVHDKASDDQWTHLLAEEV